MLIRDISYCWNEHKRLHEAKARHRKVQGFHRTYALSCIKIMALRWLASGPSDTTLIMTTSIGLSMEVDCPTTASSATIFSGTCSKTHIHQQRHGPYRESPQEAGSGGLLPRYHLLRDSEQAVHVAAMGQGRYLDVAGQLLGPIRWQGRQAA